MEFNSQSLRIVGIPWYDQVDYSRIKSVMRDSQLLPATHAEWLEKAQRFEHKVRAAGVVVVRAVIRPDEFVVWCAAHGLDVDAKARTQYANLIAAHHQQS